MATMMRFAGQRGVNMDAVAEWSYEEKGAGKDAVTPVIHLTFADGHQAEYSGNEARALHGYLCSVGGTFS